MRLAQINSLEERDKIREALEESRKKSGSCARSWPEVFAALRAIKLPGGGGLTFSREGLPLDPSGAPYKLINAEDKCDVDLDVVTTKIPPG